MTEKKLYLIGTNHFDLKGPERLTRALNYIQPKIIALEMAKDRDHFVAFEEKEGLKNKMMSIIDDSGVGFSDLKKTVFFEANEIVTKNYGYELRTPQEFISKKPQTKLEYIDICLFENGFDQFKNEVLDSFKELLSMIKENPELRTYLAGLFKNKEQYLAQHQQGVDSTYNQKEAVFELYKKLIANPNEDLRAFKNILNPKRDENMSKKIRELYANLLSGNICSVVGLAHLPGIQQRIFDLNPISLTLLEASNTDFFNPTKN